MTQAFAGLVWRVAVNMGLRVLNCPFLSLTTLRGRFCPCVTSRNDLSASVSSSAKWVVVRTRDLTCIKDSRVPRIK